MTVRSLQVARREGQADTISKEMADLKQRHLVQYQALQKAGPQLKECKVRTNSTAGLCNRGSLTLNNRLS